MKASSIIWILILLMLGFMLLTPGIHGGMFFWIVLLLGLFLVLNMLFTSESDGKGRGNEDKSLDASDGEAVKIDELAEDIHLDSLVFAPVPLCSGNASLLAKTYAISYFKPYHFTKSSCHK